MAAMVQAWGAAGPSLALVKETIRSYDRIFIFP